MLILVSIMSSIKLCKDDEISCNQIYPLCNVITHVMTLYLENYVRSKQFEYIDNPNTNNNKYKRK